jgi:Ca-activated chloride channel family protein
VSFESPYLLLALAIVPVAAIAYWLLERRRERQTTTWSAPALLPNVVRRPRHGLRHLPAALFLLGLTLLLVGFARPHRTVGDIVGGSPTVVLAFDVSGSMAADDLGRTRLRAARELAIRFLNELPANDQVAVMTFGNDVHVTLPPTLDRQLAVAHFPKAVTPEAGTAIGDAVSDAVAVVVQTVGRAQPGLLKPGSVLLLSDGAQTGGGTSPAAAATTALSEGVPVDTIAIGTQRGLVTQPVKVQSWKARLTIPVPVDQTTLKAISQRSQGSYFEAGSPSQVAALPAQLTSVYQSLSAPIQAVDRTQALTAAAGVAALVCILAGILLSGLWFGRSS